MELSEHAARNREEWNRDAPNWVENGRRSWASPTPWWGAWHIPEEELEILPDVSGLDVLDLGCGTGYFCAWFMRLGAKPVGLDVSENQLRRSRTGPSTWSSRSTGPRSGATRSSGSRTPTACSGPAGA